MTNLNALALCRARLGCAGDDAQVRLPFWGRLARRVVLVFGNGSTDEAHPRAFCQALASLCGEPSFTEVELRLSNTEASGSVKAILSLANWLAVFGPEAEISLTGKSRLLPLCEITPGLAARLAVSVHMLCQNALRRVTEFPTFPVLRYLCIDDWIRAIPAGRHIRDFFPAGRTVTATLNSHEPCIQGALQELATGLKTARLCPDWATQTPSECGPISIGPDTEVVLEGYANYNVVTGGKIVESVIYESASFTDALYGAERVTLRLVETAVEVERILTSALPNCVQLTASSNRPLPRCTAACTSVDFAHRHLSTRTFPAPPVSDKIDAALDDLLRRAPVLRRLYIDPCSIDVCRLGRLPNTLRLVDMATWPGPYHYVPMELVLAAIRHLFAMLSTRCSSGHPVSIGAPSRTNHTGCRAYCRAIADVRMAAKPDGDAPDVWLPAEIPWEFRGEDTDTDTGPPAGLRVRAVVVGGIASLDSQSQFQSGHSGWARDVHTLVLHPPLPFWAAMHGAASRLAGVFCDVCEVRIPVRLTSDEDMSAARGIICAVGARLRKIVSSDVNRLRKCTAIHSACPWVEHATYHGDPPIPCAISGQP